MKRRLDPQPPWRQAVRTIAVIVAVGALCTSAAAAAQSNLTGPPSAFTVALSTSPPESPTPTPDGGARRSPLSIEQFDAVLSAEAQKPRFNGSLLGWRIASFAVLEAAGIGDRNLSRSCEPYAAGAETPTQLDFTVGYLPPDLKVGPVEGPFKWLCGKEGLSVLSIYNVDTPLGAGQIYIERSIQGRQAIEMDVPADSVEAAAINGKPAIFAHPFDDALGFGIGRIVVIEGGLGPDFTILSVTADNGIPFAELVAVAEGIK